MWQTTPAWHLSHKLNAVKKKYIHRIFQHVQITNSTLSKHIKAKFLLGIFISRGHLVWHAKWTSWSLIFTSSHWLTAPIWLAGPMWWESLCLHCANPSFLLPKRGHGCWRWRREPLSSRNMQINNYRHPIKALDGISGYSLLWSPSQSGFDFDSFFFFCSVVQHLLFTLKQNDKCCFPHEATQVSWGCLDLFLSQKAFSLLFKNTINCLTVYFKAV